MKSRRAIDILRSPLIRQASIYLGSSVFASSVPFLLLPILTSHLSPEEYGLVAVFTVWSSFLTAFCGLNVVGYANRRYFDFLEKRDQYKTVLYVCMLILLWSSCFVITIVFLFNDEISALINLPKNWLLYGVVFASSTFIYKLRLGQWQVREQSTHYAFFEGFKAIVDFSLSFYFVVYAEAGAVGRVWGYMITMVIFASIAVFLLVKDRLLAFKTIENSESVKSALRFGVPLMPHVLGLFLLNMVDRAVISNVLNLEKAGIYMVAAQIGMVISLVLQAVNKAYVPWLFRKLKIGEYKQKIKIVKFTYFYYAVLFVFVGLAFSLDKGFILIAIDERYSEVIYLIPWIFLAQAFKGGYLTVTNYLFYEKRTGELATITIICGLINVALLVYLTSHYQLVGAAWSFVISMFLQWVTTWFVANKRHPMPWALKRTL